MNYYDKYGGIEVFNGNHTNLEGANGEIFRCPNNIAYKRYFSYAENKIKQSIFDFIQSINNPHIVKLLERYYIAEDITDLDRFLYEVNHSNKDFNHFNSDFHKIDLYTYEWVEEDYIDILEQSVDYLLDNLNELLRLADYFSMNGVAMNDMKVANLICNRDRIVLIDPDMYYYVSDQESKASLMIQNRRCIFQTLRSVCKRLTEYRGVAVVNSINGLFEESIENPKYGISLLSKKLSGCKMPIDYVSKAR